MYVELLVGNESGTKVYQPVVQEGIEWSTERKNTPGKLVFKVLYDNILDFSEGSPVRMKVDGDNVFFGFVFKQQRSKDKIITVTAYDQLRYLKNKDTKVYENKTASQFVKMITNKSCPGDWLYNRLGDLAARVTTNLGGSQSSNNDVLYRVQTGAFSVKENADRMLEKVKAAGFDTYMIQVDGMYKIQVGAYSKKENADAMANKLKAAGFDTFITTHGGQAVSTTSTPTREVTIGSAVRLKKGAKTYSGGSLASFVYERNHQVTQLSGDRAVISYKGTVVAAVHKDDLILV